MGRCRVSAVSQSVRREGVRGEAVVEREWSKAEAGRSLERRGRERWHGEAVWNGGPEREPGEPASARAEPSLRCVCVRRRPPWNVSRVDQLAWLARANGYDSYLKVPCVAREGAGSVELGSWSWDYRRRKYVKVRRGTHAAYLHPLGSVAGGVRITNYHAHRKNGVQDMLLVDAADASLGGLAARLASDCAVGGAAVHQTRGQRETQMTTHAQPPRARPGNRLPRRAPTRRESSLDMSYSRGINR